LVVAAADDAAVAAVTDKLRRSDGRSLPGFDMLRDVFCVAAAHEVFAS
jgi:hypothetical protein